MKRGWKEETERSSHKYDLICGWEGKKECSGHNSLAICSRNRSVMLSRLESEEAAGAEEEVAEDV